MVTVIAWPRLMTPEIAQEYCGGPKIFDALKEEKLIAPRVQLKGLTRYDRFELDAALNTWKGFRREET
jgi:hypothetical protein